MGDLEYNYISDCYWLCGDKEKETRGKRQETRGKEQVTRDKEQETRGKGQETREGASDK